MVKPILVLSPAFAPQQRKKMEQYLNLPIRITLHVDDTHLLKSIQKELNVLGVQSAIVGIM